MTCWTAQLHAAHTFTQPHIPKAQNNDKTQEQWRKTLPPLICSIIDDDIPAIQIELNHNAFASEFTSGDVSALHYAAKGNLEAFRLLLKRGACMTATDLPGFSPIHYAVVGGGNLQIIKLLIEKIDKYYSVVPRY